MLVSEPRTASVYAFFGLIAAGKSAIAQAFANRHRLPLYNSDRVRKELAGIAPTQRHSGGLDTGIYTAAYSRRTYDALLQKAGNHLAAGNSVILDASYHRREERELLRSVAASHSSRACFIHCTCPEAEISRRLAKRSLDPLAVSDGSWEIYLNQKERFEPPDPALESGVISLDTGQPLAAVLASLESLLGENGPDALEICNP